MAPQGGSTLSKMPEGIIMLSQPPGIRGMSAKTSSGQTILELAMAKMRVVQVRRPKGPLELVERDIPEPQQGTVRVRVQTCGICHSDTVTKDGLLPGIEYPRVPGHEVSGLGSVGTAAIAAIVAIADAATVSPARPRPWPPVSPPMEVTPIT